MKKQTSLTPTERRDWLRLARAAHVGPITFLQLLRRFGSAKAALDALPDMARLGGRRTPPTLPPLAHIEDELAAIEARGGRLLCLCEPDYPEALAAIESAPPVLTVLGRVELLHKRTIGIVGARNASINGRKMAARLAADLSAEGLVVASGLARGVDAAAHEAALSCGTVGVLAGGVNVIYPPENAGLFARMEEGGCIVSEQPWGSEPMAHLFPKRNRIISGLSYGVVVVEAARKSGSLITARMALEQGREVFAVPGFPLDPRASGTNDLLRQGAVLTESAADILGHVYTPPRRLCEPEADPFEPMPMPFSGADIEAAREKIAENLGTSPISVDELVRQCQLSLPLVLSVLMELELAGRLDRQPGHQVALIGP